MNKKNVNVCERVLTQIHTHTHTVGSVTALLFLSGWPLGSCVHTLALHNPFSPQHSKSS